MATSARTFGDADAARARRPAFVGRETASPQEAANWSRRQIILTELRAVRGRAYPRVRGTLREKSWVFFEILLPFLSTSAFVFVYRALKAPPDYIGFASARQEHRRPAV